MKSQTALSTRVITGLFFITSLLSFSALAGKYNQVLSLGDAMPAFSDLPTTNDTSLSSADLSEQVVVLVSLANHCPWVKGMDQQLVALVDQFRDKDVRVVGFGVNHREDDRLPAMKAHAEAVGYNFTYVYDESQALGRALGATITPEYFVFNQERKLTYMGLITDSPAMLRDGKPHYINGDPSEFYAHDAISQTLAGEAVTVSETRAHGCTVKYQKL